MRTNRLSSFQQLLKWYVNGFTSDSSNLDAQCKFINGTFFYPSLEVASFCLSLFSHSSLGKQCLFTPHLPGPKIKSRIFSSTEEREFSTHVNKQKGVLIHLFGFSERGGSLVKHLWSLFLEMVLILCPFFLSTLKRGGTNRVGELGISSDLSDL